LNKWQGQDGWGYGCVFGDSPCKKEGGRRFQKMGNKPSFMKVSSESGNQSSTESMLNNLSPDEKQFYNGFGNDDQYYNGVPNADKKRIKYTLNNGDNNKFVQFGNDNGNMQPINFNSNLYHNNVVQD
jgi:hypothetical protein